MTDQLIAPTFLFRFSVPCRSTNRTWTNTEGVKLTPKYTIPSFQAELGEGPQFADLRVAWSAAGMVFQLQVQGKKQAPWCRESRLDDSDGLRLWIDTRDTHTVHRASRFCHQFVFLPQGEGAKQQHPIAELLNIDRARDNPVQPARGTIQVRSEQRVDGYLMQGFVPSAAITGYDPNEHPKLGFYYAIMDRELGWQTLSLGSEYPFQTDPSLWGTLELVK
jgi:hypothetical protein